MSDTEQYNYLVHARNHSRGERHRSPPGAPHVGPQRVRHRDLMGELVVTVAVLYHSQRFVWLVYCSTSALQRRRTATVKPLDAKMIERVNVAWRALSRRLGHDFAEYLNQTGRPLTSERRKDLLARELRRAAHDLENVSPAQFIQQFDQQSEQQHRPGHAASRRGLVEVAGRFHRGGIGGKRGGRELRLQVQLATVETGERSGRAWSIGWPLLAILGISYMPIIIFSNSGGSRRRIE